jgi:hypothetical protein
VHGGSSIDCLPACLPAHARWRQLKHQVAEVASIRQQIRTAMQSKDYQSAIACCGRGLAMDGEDRKLHAAMYANRARAYGVPIRVVRPTRAHHQLCPPRDWLRLPYHPRGYIRVRTGSREIQWCVAGASLC